MILVDLEKIGQILKDHGAWEDVMDSLRGVKTPARGKTTPVVETPDATAKVSRNTPARPPRVVERHVTVRHGARVRYTGTLNLTHERIKALPESDALVYRAIKKTAGGATRNDLLTALNATDRTGVVDGALRRLRLRDLIKTTNLE